VADGEWSANLDAARLRQQVGRIARGVAARRVLWREQPIYRSKVRSKFTAPYYRRQFRHFGDGTILERPMWLYGASHISLGDLTVILRGAWLAVERPAWGNPDPVLTIGARFAARPFITISAASSVVIEKNVGMASFSTIIDSDHTWTPGSTHVMDSPSKASPIHIGEGTFISERVAILGGARIGRQCFIGANTVVKTEVPDYSIVLGVPGRVVGTTKPD
jgi:acetyltransferase-like isoleucine patch superfamily enzyme